MAEVDYGYGDQNDYGYGDATPDNDMGYGVAEPDNTMGYGYAAPDTDYGYGDAAPDEPEAAVVVDKRPKRRCSVTKFSLASETPLTAASVINDLRMGLPVAPLPPASSDGDCAKSTVTDDTLPECAPPSKPAPPKKNGMISRIRRRLSVAG